MCIESQTFDDSPFIILHKRKYAKTLKCLVENKQGWLITSMHELYDVEIAIKKEEGRPNWDKKYAKEAKNKILSMYCVERGNIRFEHGRLL